MPQNTTIVLKDGVATPVNHSFVPKGPIGSNGEYVFRDSLGTITFDGGQAMLSVERRPLASSSPTEKVRLKIALPLVTTQIVNGVSQDVVAYSDLCTIETVLSKTSSKARRKDLLAYAASALAAASIQSVVVDGEAFW